MSSTKLTSLGELPGSRACAAINAQSRNIDTENLAFHRFILGLFVVGVVALRQKLRGNKKRWLPYHRGARTRLLRSCTGENATQKGKDFYLTVDT